MDILHQRVEKHNEKGTVSIQKMVLKKHNRFLMTDFPD